MTSYSPHSLCGASSPSLPLPHILQPQGMAEESLAENQLVPEAGLQTGKEARRASSRMELKRADLKKTLPGKIEGWGGKQGQRDGDTDRETLDLHGWELVGSGLGTGQPEPPPHHFVIPPDGPQEVIPMASSQGFVAGQNPVAGILRASEDKVPQSWVRAMKRNSFPCHLHKAPCVLKPERKRTQPC